MIKLYKVWHNTQIYGYIIKKKKIDNLIKFIQSNI